MNFFKVYNRFIIFKAMYSKGVLVYPISFHKTVHAARHKITHFVFCFVIYVQ